MGNTVNSAYMTGSAFKSCRQAKKVQKKETTTAGSLSATRQLCVILRSTAPCDKGLGGAAPSAATCAGLLRCRLRRGTRCPALIQHGHKQTMVQRRSFCVDSPSVLLTASVRMLYSWILSLWCWNSFFRFSSSSAENFPELFACWTDEWGLWGETDTRLLFFPTGNCTSTHLVPQFVEPGIVKGLPLLRVVVLQRVAFHWSSVSFPIHPILGEDHCTAKHRCPCNQLSWQSCQGDTAVAWGFTRKSKVTPTYSVFIALTRFEEVLH